MPGDPGRDLELAVLRLAWRVDALDKWRERTDGRLGQAERMIGELSTKDEIAEAVAARVDADQHLALSGWQKLGALIAGALIVADSIKGIVS